eukprot:8250707-Lingulodinium_polyedra.AAC.1
MARRLRDKLRHAARSSGDRTSATSTCAPRTFRAASGVGVRVAAIGRATTTLPPRSAPRTAAT